MKVARILALATAAAATLLAAACCPNSSPVTPTYTPPVVPAK